MEFFDELTAIYPRQDALTQKYLLRAFAGLPKGHAGPGILDILWRESSSASAPVRHQARRELGTWMPAYWRHRHDTVAQAPAARKDAIPVEAGALAAGLEALSPLVPVVLDRLYTGSYRDRQAASLIAAALPLRRCIDALESGVRADTASFGHAAALAQTADPRTGDVLIEIARERGIERPDLLMLLASVPQERTLDLLERAETKTDALGRMNVAIALCPPRSPRAIALLERLIDRAEGWVSAFALEALAASPRPEHLPLVKRALDRERHEFIQVLAVRVASRVPGREAEDILQRCLDRPLPRVAAAALEALNRRDFTESTLAAVAQRLHSMPHLCARVASLLYWMPHDPDRVTEPLQELLVSPVAGQRVEGAYVLGHLPGPEAISLLTRMARLDPAAAVRAQAVGRLSRRAEDGGWRSLLDLAVDADPERAIPAAAALEGASRDCLGAHRDELEAGIVRTAVPGARARLLRLLGEVAARVDAAHVPDTILEALSDRDCDIVLGAVDGLEFLGSRDADERERALATHSDVRVRARAAAMAFLAGDLDAPGRLADVLSHASQESSAPLLDAMLTMALGLRIAAGSDRFKHLTTRLKARQRAASLQPFIGRDPSVQAPEGDDAAYAADPQTGSAPSTSKEVGPARRDAGGFLRKTDERLLAFYQHGTPLEQEQASAGAAGASGLPGGIPSGILDSPVSNGAGPAVADGSSPSVGRARHRGAPPPGGMPGRLPFSWPLVALVLAIGIPAGIIISHRGSAARDASAGSTRHRTGPPPPGAFRITSLSGAPSRTSPDGARSNVSQGDLLTQGESLTTGAKEQVSLSGAEGSSLWLGPGSSVSLGAAPTTTDGPMTFTQARGDLVFDLREAPLVNVTLPDRRLIGRRAAFRLQWNETVRTTSLSVGELEIAASGAPPRPVAVGETVQLSEPSP